MNHRCAFRLARWGMVLSMFGIWSICMAQSTSTGTLSGQVTDQSNAVVAGAEVALIDASTNSRRTTTTNDTGRYTFINVQPATYDVTVEKSGFTQTRVAGQKVEVGLVLTLNVTMQLGSTSTVVEVRAAAGAELQTTNATVGSTISGAVLQTLPNLGRDANAFFVLQPGVAPTGEVAGAVRDQNTYQLDGGNNSSDMDGSSNVYTPSSGFVGTASAGGTPSGVIPTPSESIEEFKVGTNNQTADFNGSAGGQVQMVTKRGTNQWHGSGYDYYFSTNVGAANSWKNNHTPSGGLPYTPVPVSHQNRFGASLGGTLTPSFWGGKTYFFFNYEGRRFPQVAQYERTVPTALLRAGVIQIQNAGGQYIPYNLNPVPVTVGGATYQPATCGGVNCDPRGLGLSPIVSQIWNKQIPLPNDPQFGDKFNTQGYLTTVPLPQSSNFAVARLDHDFGEKWRLLLSYRYYRFTQLTTNQVDIGGVLSGDSLGQAAAKALRPQVPSYYVAGLTTTITPNMTNDFHFNYLRNYWQWGSAAAPPQLPGLGGAVEIGGETSSSTLGGGPNALIPYNVNTQDARQRFWDGHDYVLRDDISKLTGNHLFQFGGTYQHNYDFHSRNDNGVGIMNSTVYQVASGSGISIPSAYVPGTVPANQVANYNAFYSDVLGLVSQPQTLYTRTGPNLQLQPLGTPMFDQSIIPYYSLYFSDTWHLKPTFTLTYGMSYQIEMPPYEINGKQVALVDTAAHPIEVTDYLAQRQKAALAGQVYNPTVGFATVRNVAGGGEKYPFDPFYGGFSPRVAAAWNPNFDSGILGSVFGRGKTVIRGGYSRLYGRLNGVNLVLVPLLGTGLGQAVSCIGASRGGQCLGPAGVDPNTAFRIGGDGLTAPLPAVSATLPQPYFPGVGGNAAAGDGSVLDPHMKPNRSDQFDITIQRELSSKFSIEVGYIGRILRNEFQSINIDAVPHMTTLDGQSFAQAFASTYFAVNAGQTPAPQAFFEQALGGPNSSFCKGFASCTAAVASNQKSNILTTRVYDMWAALNKASSWTLGRTMPSSVPAQLSSVDYINSLGYSNYNGAFLTLKMRNWRGLTAVSNFTWSRSLGTGAYTQSTSSYTALNPWDLHSMYGTQPFDIRFVYNLSMLYEVPFFRTQRGLVGRVLGGWQISPLFTAQSGLPLPVSVNGGANTNCQSFGEFNCSSGNTNGHENAPLLSAYTSGNSAHNNVVASGIAGATGNASASGSGINEFADPGAVYSQFRRLILGYDTSGGGSGILRGFPNWNVDVAIFKEVSIAREGRIGATLSVQISNVLNHFQPANPTLNLDSPGTFGVVTGQSTTILSRQMEFGLRIHF